MKIHRPAAAVAASLAIVVVGVLGLWPAGEPPATAEVPSFRPVAGTSLHHDVSPPLRDIPALAPAPAVHRPLGRRPVAAGLPDGGILFRDPALQDWAGPLAMPSPIQNFLGTTNLSGGLPPDTNGDVGPDHYVQWVNVSFQIFDKEGNSLVGPAAGNTLWAGFGGPCQTTNDGDPIALYDPIANRWLMTQFALPNFPFGPFYQCFAVSTTPDPTDSWNRYAFLVHSTKMNDYPKIGVWPDAYYMTVNQFDQGTLDWAGQGVFAFDRAKMLANQAATFVYFDLAPVNINFGGMLPSDLDGPTLPPPGSPNYFVEMDDNAWGWATDRLSIWEFLVDFVTPGNSTFGISGQPNAVLDTASFDSDMCAYEPDCIPQPATAQGLDAISDRLMYHLQYRNHGTHETLVTNHTVDANGSDRAGVRWYEIRDPGASPAIFQQGTYSPDTKSRWMGSAAMDHSSNIAVGYSISASSTTRPSIRYAGRLAADTPGTLGQGEATLQSGSGSQTHVSGRWGDYSSLNVDPLDDCTFWYTNEYYSSTSASNWKTRIGSFKFPGCSKGIVVGRADYDGVSTRDDIGVFRNGMWFLTHSPDYSGIDLGTAFGSPVADRDQPEMGEFGCVAADGGYADGQADIAVLRKPFSTWFVSLSPDYGSSADLAVTFGSTSHKRMPTRHLDTNGDGCSDIGVYKGGCFSILESPSYSTSLARTVCFGASTDLPLAGDLNGDGMSDLLLWRSGTSLYSYRLSPDYDSTSTESMGSGDVAVVGDLNGDGMTDLGSYKMSTSTFRFTFSPDFVGTDLQLTFGVNGDVPILAEVNGDGRTDIGIFRDSIARWWFQCSPAWSSTCVSLSFGVSGDDPIYGKPVGMP